jgi:arsenate reductase
MKKKVLFICVHNSARSQIATAWLNDICGDYFEAQSAGLEPGQLNPLAVQVMDERDRWPITRAGPSLMSLRVEMFAYAITVCDESETAGCPIFAGVTKRLHWSFPDPSALTGTYEQRLEGTRRIRDDIRARIETWCDEMCAVDA